MLWPWFITSQQIFHTSRTLSWYMQNFIVIDWAHFKPEHCKFLSNLIEILFVHHVRRKAMLHTWLFGLKGNQQVLLHHHARSPPANGSQSPWAMRTCVIGNYSKEGSMLSDNSMLGVLMFLGFATYKLSIIFFVMLNASDNKRDRLWCKDQGVLVRAIILASRLASCMIWISITTVSPFSNTVFGDSNAPGPIICLETGKKPLNYR